MVGGRSAPASRHRQGDRGPAGGEQGVDGPLPDPERQGRRSDREERLGDLPDREALRHLGLRVAAENGVEEDLLDRLMAGDAPGPQ